MNINPIETLSTCKHNTDIHKLIKTLFFAKKLILEIPQDLPKDFLELSNTYRYLSKNIDQIQFVNTGNSRFGAVNKGQGLIDIYPMAFQSGLINLLTLLVHEARHTSPHAATHTQCKYGFIKKLSKSCDEKFVIHDNSGAYTFETMFLLLASENKKLFSSLERKQMYATALFKLGTYFNSHSEKLSLPFESIVYIANNAIYLLHPILNYPIWLGKVEGLHFTRIKKSEKPLEINILTEQNEAYSLNIYFNDLYAIAKGKKIIDYVNLIYKDKNGYFNTNDYLIDQNNTIWFKDIDPTSGKKTWKRPVFQSEKKIKALLQGLETKRFVLFTDGELGVFSNSGIESFNFSDPEKKGWVHVTGGFSRNSLFGVNKDGDLFSSDQNGEPLFNDQFRVEKSIFYDQSSSFDYQMNEEGQLFVRSFDKSKISKINLTHFNHTVVSLSHILSFNSQMPKLNEYSSKSCGLLSQASIDPWSNKYMGINNKGELVFEISKAECKGKDFIKKVKSYSFLGNEQNEKNDYLAVSLKIIFEDNSETILSPYNH